jgi:formyl-CoA transferase
VMAGVILDAHWRKLVALMQRTELADDPRYATTAARIERRAEVDALLADWLATRTADEALAALLGAGLPIAKVRSYAEAAADPHVRARDMLQDVAQQDGTSRPITGPAAKLSRTPLRIRSGAPALGAHSDEILREAGFDAAAIATFRKLGVV